ncbi:wax ester/triacylglycerol synthase domain-containing protein [Actinomadura rubrisoli]
MRRSCRARALEGVFLMYQNPHHADAGRRLGVIERALLAYERAHPTVNLGIGGLVLFEGRPPGIHELLGQAPLHLPTQPLMSCGLSPGANRRSVWRPRPTLDLGLHVRERVLPAGAGRAGLMSLVNELLAVPFTKGEPLWRMWLIHGYDGEEFAVLYLGHHVLHDGVSAMNNIACVLLGEGGQNGRVRIPRGSGTGRARPVRVMRGAGRLASHLYPPAVRLRDEGLTGERRLAWAGTSLERMRDIGKRHGATVNTVYLAALTSALRQWSYSPWREIERRGRPLWALVPVSTRTEGEQNGIDVRIMPERTRLPCDKVHPAEQIALLKATTEAIRGSAVVDSERALRARTPGWLGHFILSRALSPGSTHLLATNVPGTDRPFDLLGRPVREIVPLSFLPVGHRLAVVLTTYQDQARAGFMVDARFASGADELAALWSAAIDELDASAGPAS